MNAGKLNSIMLNAGCCLYRDDVKNAVVDSGGLFLLHLEKIVVDTKGRKIKALPLEQEKACTHLKRWLSARKCTIH